MERSPNRATPLSFATWAFFGLLFNYFIRRKWPGWWHHYNYITAAGLDSGLVISTIVIFFAITLPNVNVPQWWGNVGVYDTVVSKLLSFWLVGGEGNVLIKDRIPCVPLCARQWARVRRLGRGNGRWLVEGRSLLGAGMSIMVESG